MKYRTHLFPQKDKRLYPLATSIRGAIQSGYSNGQSKSICVDMVYLVRQACLCDQHNVRLNVYVCNAMSENV